MPFNPIDYPATFAEPLMISLQSAWVEHIPFAYTLMECARPRRFVELGVHAGDSYCAFCQARDLIGLTTQCFGVDTWTGDDHSGAYSKEILPSLRQYHDPKYGSFSKLLQMNFDSAVTQFENKSIDLLHIDGLHTYAAVRHDFESWLPKMSERGIVLFHDTNVKLEDFGVHQLWAELSAQYPHFHFEHGMGLGVLAVGPEISPALKPLFASTPDEAIAIRNCYMKLGRAISLRSMFSAVMQGAFTAQAQINRWKQQTGHPVSPHSQDAQVAMQEPGYFVHQLLQDVNLVLAADMSLRKQITR